MVKYIKEDAGCYVNGVRGIYATDKIVNIARDHGAEIVRDCECDHEQSCFDSEFASCEFANEYEDKADDYMNEKYSVSGHYWGRGRGEDWGLWECEEDYY
jgi:hypothetical protein